MKLVELLKFYIRYYMVKSKFTLRPYVFFKKIFDDKYARLVVGPKTDICIEGYPRCANSFFYNAFSEKNPEINIARHLHYPLQVIDALKNDIPCVVLYRHPLDCVSSLSVGMPYVPIYTLVEWYIYFYERILDVLEDKRVVLISFEEVVADFDACVNKVNRVSKTQYNHVSVDDNLEKVIFDKLKDHAASTNNVTLTPIPSESKENRKSEVKAGIKNCSNFKSAMYIYERVNSMSSAKDACASS